ncbi:AMP-binding protein [Pseudomonas sp. LFM046]|uniref:AMP-binding protein n=1 Tax=Pseudomonas sp. LFM046 TaxID=1608357 RepID=UPI0005CFD9DF|nr:AMP-binding protein [Pseudomonas sp. LFM046]
MSDATPTTLPAWLAHQARQRPTGIALRHKRLGVWQVRNWAQVQAEVLALAGALRAAGFGPGAQLAILSRPRPEALFAALAAQWLGGTAAPFDPLEEAAGQATALRQAGADFVFAEGLEEILRVRQSDLAPTWLAYADGRGLVDPQVRAGALDYGRLLAAEAEYGAPPVRAEDIAFAFYRQRVAGVEQQSFSHAELLQEGERLVRGERLSEREDALAARAFAASGQARYLLAPWLLAGFRLNFPERLETRDQDRRELGPSLVLGTRETYGRLHELVRQRLPLPGSLRRRLVDWALEPDGGALRSLLGQPLVRRPLRDVLGFSRTRVALLVGAPLDEETRRFFTGLGIEVRNWPAAERWHPVRGRDVTGWPSGQPQLA